MKKDKKNTLVKVNNSIYWEQKDNTFFIEGIGLDMYIKDYFKGQNDPEGLFAEQLVKWDLPEKIEELFISKFNEIKKAHNIHLEKVKEKRNKLVKSYQ